MQILRAVQRDKKACSLSARQAAQPEMGSPHPKLRGQPTKHSSCKSLPSNGGVSKQDQTLGLVPSGERADHFGRRLQVLSPEDVLLQLQEPVAALLLGRLHQRMAGSSRPLLWLPPWFDRRTQAGSHRTAACSRSLLRSSRGSRARQDQWPWSLNQPGCRRSPAGSCGDLPGRSKGPGTSESGLRAARPVFREAAACATTKSWPRSRPVETPPPAGQSPPWKALLQARACRSHPCFGGSPSAGHRGHDDAVPQGNRPQLHWREQGGRPLGWQP